MVGGSLPLNAPKSAAVTIAARLRSMAEELTRAGNYVCVGGEPFLWGYMAVIMSV